VIGTTEGGDRAHMWAALRLARRGLGQVWPNPAVGCILVNDGAVVGRGWTQPGGRPHAETEALRRAGAAAHGSVAYVTLEPCAHRGETGSCAQALIDAGVARAVVALRDRDPRVDGRGCELLKGRGIDVVVGVGEETGREINAGFVSRVTQGRPLITLKLATTLDGRIATSGGDSRWITGAPARSRAHMLRAQADAVMIGARTVLADDPELTCRLPGLESRSPIRVVVDGQLTTPTTAKVVRDALTVPTWIITIAGCDEGRRAALARNGVDVIEVVADSAGKVEIEAALALLGDRGLTRVLVEGGGRLAGSLMANDLVDRMVWFQAPKIIGRDGVAAVAISEVVSIDDARTFRRLSTAALGEDMVNHMTRLD
jgi:diaminohydroxyphosphoribosylaminopyrimidine deaminase/5-amino-6-(5-phosphoribosylamino)uracil reductase